MVSRKHKINRAIDFDDIKDFFKCFNDKYKTILSLCLLQGFRISECLELSINNNGNKVDICKRCIRLQRQKNGNDGEIVALRHKSCELLEWYLMKYQPMIEKNNGWLFWSQLKKGYHISRAAFCKKFHDTRIKLGLDNEVYGKTKDGKKLHRITVHSTRHFFIMNAIKNMISKVGFIDERSLQILSRHKNKMSLDPYIHITPDIKRKINDMYLD